MRLFISLILLCGVVGGVFALPPMPNTVYFGTHGGAAIPGGGDKYSLQTGYLVSGELGYRFDRVRMEGQATFIRNHPQVKSAVNDNRLAYLANLYYDIPLSDTVMPYFGGGIGVVQNWLSNSADTYAEADAFGFQFITGMGFNLTANVMLDFRYRYLGVSDSRAATNALEVGLNYTFS